MGTWGVGVFENDVATDLMYEFVQADPIEYIIEAFEKHTADYLESDDAHKILISAAVLDITLTGMPYSDFHYEDYGPFVEKLKVLGVSSLVPLALKAVDRVLRDDSELLELWDESSSADHWYQVVSSIYSRLSEL